MSKTLVGYARVSTQAQDLTAQRAALAALGVESERIYVDRGFTGTTPKALAYLGAVIRHGHGQNKKEALGCVRGLRALARFDVHRS
ncbi:recombinase family protein [Arthrobacter sp. SO3]|uniref:recombinase family protein n=1 Tax=Arthrobacter sp. SO3 TaxID=1897057 RepID=UPI0021F66F49|nr:recombinase family protein [Arthrobacter sp. SO3]